MPWTFAHPAAVLPIARLAPRQLSFPALVAGAIAPDAFYYVGRFDIATLAHTPLGLVAICGPVGLVLLALLRALARPLVELLPAPHREALLSLESPAWPRGARAWALLYASIVIGAATHLFWDAFTHANGWFVEAFPVLATPLFPAGSRTVHVYDVLQHLSTIAGSAILAACYWRFLQAAARGGARTSAPEHRRYAVLAALIGIAAATGATAAYAESATSLHAVHAGVLFVRSVIYGTSALALLLCVAAAVNTRRSSSRPDEGSGALRTRRPQRAAK